MAQTQRQQHRDEQADQQQRRKQVRLGGKPEMFLHRDRKSVEQQSLQQSCEKPASGRTRRRLRLEHRSRHLRFCLLHYRLL
jgi:hypothetical protein